MEPNENMKRLAAEYLRQLDRVNARIREAAERGQIEGARVHTLHAMRSNLISALSEMRGYAG